MDKRYLTLALLLLIWDTSTHADIDVRRPPNIDTQGEEQVIYLPDDSLVIPCIASGTPQPGYTWQVNGRELDTNSRNIKMSDVDGSITIDPLTSLDEGYYQCFASNQYGTALSRKTRLLRAVLSTYQPSETATFTVKEGEQLKIPCKELKTFPPPSFSWKLAKDQIDAAPTELRMSSRMTIDKQGNLYFSYVKKEDERDGKLYKCMVFNNYLDLTTGGSYAQINVQAGSLDNKAPTVFFHTDSPHTVLRNEEARLKCFFAGNPAPSVSWKRLGSKNLPPGRHRIEDDKTTLVILDVEDDDEGDYECTGSNNVDPPAKSVISLKVESKPEFINNFKVESQNATEQRRASFLCKTNAEPKADINWLINGEPINAADPGPRRVISSDMTNLTIMDTCKNCPGGTTDLMVVQCNASNVHGYAFSSGYLNVLLATHIETAPKDEIIVPVNQLPEEEREGHVEKTEVTFNCSAVTDDSTPLGIRWLRKTLPIYADSDPRVKIKTINGFSTLDINITGLEDYGAKKYMGIYTCKASNENSEASMHAKYSIQGVVIAEEQTSGLASLWWIFVLIALLLLLLILLLCCCIYLRRNKGDSYPVDEKERLNGNDPVQELQDTGFKDYQRPKDAGRVKGSRASLSSTVRLDDESDAGSMGDFDMARGFNEDGSFIEQYSTMPRSGV